jgi:hypothetical protein
VPPIAQISARLALASKATAEEIVCGGALWTMMLKIQRKSRNEETTRFALPLPC